MKEDFKAEFEKRVRGIEGLEEIEWLGSIADEFIPGRSDLDLIIHGDVAAADKEKISHLIKELNYKHGLGLEDAPYQHPTPFFVDNALKRAGYNFLVPGGGLRFIDGFRRTWKHHAPTYGQVWRLEERAEKHLPSLTKLIRRIAHDIL